MNIEICRNVHAVASRERHLVEVDHFCTSPGFHTWIKEIERRIAAFDSCEPYPGVDVWPEYRRDRPESFLALQNAYELLVIMAHWFSLEITPDRQPPSSETQVLIKRIGAIIFLWMPVPVVIAIKVLNEVPLTHIARRKLTCFRVGHHLGDLPAIIMLVYLKIPRLSLGSRYNLPRYL